MYQEFKETYYYWDFIRAYLKLGVVAIHNFYNQYLYTKGILIGFFILAYLILTMRK